MRIVRDISGGADCAGGVLVIGNFDGVHLGHAALIEKARALASGAPVAVLTFEPHPRVLFRPDDPPFRIAPPEQKLERLEAAGVDVLYSLTFDWDFASQTAERFVEDILIKGIRPAHVVVGQDFHFGQMRKGNARTIGDAGIPVHIVDPVKDASGEVISSSRIRQELRHGNIEKANALLGWNWEISGTVRHGDKRGRELGYPTANFPLGDIVHPAYGVYAALVQIAGEHDWRGAAINIGIRPMFEVAEAQVEAYIFDFSREIYGEQLKIRPVSFLRGEAKFGSLEELKAQMAQDCRQSLEIMKDLR